MSRRFDHRPLGKSLWHSSNNMRPATVHITKEMAVNKNPMNNNNREKKQKGILPSGNGKINLLRRDLSVVSRGVGRTGEKSAKVVTKRANRETQREEEDGVFISIINFAQTALEIINGSALDWALNDLPFCFRSATPERAGSFSNIGNFDFLQIIIYAN